MKKSGAVDNGPNETLGVISAISIVIAVLVGVILSTGGQSAGFLDIKAILIGVGTGVVVEIGLLLAWNALQTDGQRRYRGR